MKINILTALKNPNKRFDFDFDFMPEGSLTNNNLAYFSQKALLSGSYYYLNGNVFVKGRLKYKIVYPCDRCLKSVEHYRDIEFEEMFCKNAQSPEDYIYSGNIVDLTKPAFDYIALDLPYGIVCSDKCRGLCHICGKDLNQGGCGCGGKNQTEEGQNPFSVLKEKL